eukprot:CAMPEP_0182484266 /NCGR_PEP_ID=MMETSP1319-20130603/43107_1 /TAXON_ID=172717 /ORGANISM="Bolidomonas pacifica, Strain RCC208" /LENGTH=72 /DNA_ID=CAMNT_0024686155 /DNA_START=67 /DNA_END=281 /DNA_ORIENTATION=-
MATASTKLAGGKPSLTTVALPTADAIFPIASAPTHAAFPSARFSPSPSPPLLSALLRAAAMKTRRRIGAAAR